MQYNAMTKQGLMVSTYIVQSMYKPMHYYIFVHC